jgi:hypothetical protein
MKERLTVRPVFHRVPYATGWVLHIRPPRGSASAPCYWGGNPKDSPEEAIAAYADRIRESFPSFDVIVKPATRAQLNRV